MAVTKTRFSVKGPAKKELIFETAIAMFQKNGFEKTTMRDIAAECDVALGNAYYYFRSKEHLVFALYEKTLELEVEACNRALVSHTAFKARLAAALHANIRVLEPYHSVLRTLLKLIADPDGALSPFGPNSEHLRRGAKSIFVDVVNGSKEKIAGAVREELPDLLWLAYMLILFYWMHDRSANREKTVRLIGLVSDLFSILVAVVSLPMMDRFWKLLVELAREFDISGTIAW
ncbi:MAG TPA: TetR family transcriptional regulator [Trichormus sp.]